MKEKAPVVTAIAAIAILTTALQPAFLSPSNLLNIVVQWTIPGVIALGMTYVIVAGGIDLSVGSTVAFASIVLGVLSQAGVSPWVSAGASLVAGAAIGAINGILVNRLRLAPFLATLGMMGIGRGGAFLLSGGEPISGTTTDLRVLYDTRAHLLPMSVALTALIAASCATLLGLTAWGRRIYAVGSNERAAWLAGISVEAHRSATYVLAGTCAALGGVLVTARLDSAQPLAGGLYELDAIAAVVIGGGSLAGGRGDVLGSMLGVLLVVELRNAVTVLGLPAHAQPLVIGILLLLAVTADMRRHSRNTGRSV